jgi:hypothetical protein
MQKTIAIGIRLGALGAMAALCTGCPNPNTYGTPRTTPVGKISHTVAAEGFHYGVDSTNRPGGTQFSGTAPTLPTYQLRVGVLDTLDIGARIANLSSFGGDVKWNFIKSDVFDMAIDPGFQVFHLSTSSGGVSTSNTEFYGHVPLILGINVADSVSIVPTAGITYALSSASVSSSDASGAASADGIMLRGGLGFNFRISPKFAMQPEVTYLKLLNKSTDPAISWVIFGLGFNFGALPEYGKKGPEKAPEGT